MKLKQKLMLNALLPLMIACIIIGFIAFQMTQVQSSNEENVDQLVYVERLASSVLSVEQGLSSFALTQTDSSVHSVQVNVENTHEILRQLADLLDEEQALTVVRKIEEKLIDLENDAIIALENYNVAEASRQSIRTSGIQNDIHLLQLMIDENYQQAQTALTTNIEFIIGFAIVAGLILLVGTSTLSFIMTNRIVKPIYVLANHADAIASGNLKKTLNKTTREDEIGQLHNSFVRMNSDLKALISNVLDTTQNVAASAEQLSANADEASSATEQISSAIQEVSTGTEDQLVNVDQSNRNVALISHDIESISNQIERVTKSSQEASFQSSQGMETVGRVIDQMDIINRNAENTSSVIEGLNQHSKEIGQIIELITDIAEQTNLLALNAAIEAARAGEHGKGFAVVADEVRKLAEQSSQSAQQINDLILLIQETTRNVVDSMEDGNIAVKEGSALVTEASHSFRSITTTVSSVDERMNEVTVSLNQIIKNNQALITSMASVSEITKSTSSHSQEVASATEEQTASIQEVSAATRALADMAQGLQDKISKFKI
ncbi:methyl-accepting chemotaxis protein [Desertibacillus haloalkaliphilus]|uniref:methyl-accepting chemotaxis protein n=1 Tax=Desertibacillus haloalkaliphilus TaxID=1328930 RepID=UPI001C279AA3|nr:methyl-accepting chemotaxis protein [Desertibacillus haloalkaliphilus]MBU8908729.1 HAMP domain-containing protein [Desertibacillus haloalkaliphilus]